MKKLFVFILIFSSVFNILIINAKNTSLEELVNELKISELMKNSNNPSRPSEKTTVEIIDNQMIIINKMDQKISKIIFTYQDANLEYSYQGEDNKILVDNWIKQIVLTMAKINQYDIKKVDIWYQQTDLESLDFSKDGVFFKVKGDQIDEFKISLNSDFGNFKKVEEQKKDKKINFSSELLIPIGILIIFSIIIILYLKKDKKQIY